MSLSKRIQDLLDYTAPELLGEKLEKLVENEVAAAVPEEPTEAMLEAARDWSSRKYGKPIGNEAARECWAAMAAAIER